MKKILFPLLAVIFGLLSCSEDIVPNKNDNQGFVIRVIDPNGIMSLGSDSSSITRTAYSGLTTTFVQGDEIGIYAVKGTTVKHSNIKVTYNGSAWVASDFIKYDEHYTYYAYYPYSASGLAADFTQTGIDNIFADGISAWTPVTNQSSQTGLKNSDLMIATGVNTTDNVISFTMQHKMAMAVLNPATLTYCYASDLTTKYNETIEFGTNKPYYNSSLNKYYYIIKPNTNTAVGGVTYNLPAGRYTEKNSNDIGSDYTLTYEVKTGNGQFNTATTTRPSWITNIVEERVPGQPLNIIFYVDSTKTSTNVWKTRTNVAKFDDELKAATPVSNYDLSMHDANGNATAQMNTANCYIVRQPGTYKIPLVYGNAIKNGATNTSAYISSLPADNMVLSNFVNHLNNAITDPWIKNNGITVSSAELVWQDYTRLITNPQISGDYLTFEITQDNIREGNALIAVKDNNGDIAWSWHIWVTRIKLDDYINTITNGGHTYNMSYIPLGLKTRQNTLTTYWHSSAMVIFTTPTGDKCRILVEQPDFTQTDYSADSQQLFYSYGRPTPFTVKKYNISGAAAEGYTSQTIDGNSLDQGNISEYIKNPMKIIYPYTSLTTSTANLPNIMRYNLWNINSPGVRIADNYSATAKTIYDPCPAGWCIPTSGLYNMKETFDKSNYVQGVQLDDLNLLYVLKFTSPVGDIYVKNTTPYIYSNGGISHQNTSNPNYYAFSADCQISTYVNRCIGFGYQTSGSYVNDTWIIATSQLCTILPVKE